jgi:hypothetical protein
VPEDLHDHPGGNALGPLGLENQATAAAALQSTADAQYPDIQVDVLPPQTERFALAQTKREPDQPPSATPIAAGRGLAPGDE